LYGGILPCDNFEQACIVYWIDGPLHLHTPVNPLLGRLKALARSFIILFCVCVYIHIYIYTKYINHILQLHLLPSSFPLPQTLYLFYSPIFHY
jgi:hypothetical protein